MPVKGSHVSMSFVNRPMRLMASMSVGALVAGGLVLALPATASAVDEVPVYSHTIDLSETRTKGHNEFRTDGTGVRVYTEGNTSQDKAAGYFQVNKTLASIGEPSMSWVAASPAVSNLKPSIQLKTDFDNDGTIDGILVGEPTYADGTPLYGNDWWLSNGSKQFVKDAAPSHVGGSGSENHGTLAGWRAAFPDAKVVQGGWSLGSGALGDGTIQAIVIGQPYYFVKSADPSTVVKYESDVNTSETRAKGHNVFRPIGGVRVTTEFSDCQDPRPTPPGGVWCANKAAGYFPAPLALSDAGEPTMAYTQYTGLKPSIQLVTDFDDNGTADAILVGETVYGRDWWVPGSAAQFVKDGAPSHEGGSGSENHGLLTEWLAKFPNAKILQVGWSLGSGAEGDGVINSITVGLTKYTFSGANRPPVAGDVAGTAKAGTSVTVTLAATDADGDVLTYSAAEGTVVGDQLTYAAPGDSVGAKVLTYTVTDSEGASDNGQVTIDVTEATSSVVLRVKPLTITTKTKNIRAKGRVFSTGTEDGGEVTLYDGRKVVGSATLTASGKYKIKLTGTLKKGKHTFKAVYGGTPTTLASEATVVVKVKKA